MAQTREPVDIDQLFNMFDTPTRKALKIDTNEFGNGVAGRGLGLNNTIAELRPLVTHAVPVLNNLASPQTALREFFIALERASGQAAPVADQQAALYVDLDTFFTAFAGASRSLEAATAGGPASLEQAIHSLPFQAPLLIKSTRFMHLLRPSAAALITVAPPLGHAFKEGAVNLKAATSLNQELAENAQALQAFGQNPVVQLGLEDFTQTLQYGAPLLAGIAPEQAICNYWTLAFRNVASLESESIGVGTIARAGFKLAPTGPNNEGYPSSSIANGGSTEHIFGSPQIIDNNRLHANPTRTSQDPASRRSAKQATRAGCRAPRSPGNLPGERGRLEPRTDEPRTEPVRRKVPAGDPEGARAHEGEGQMSRVPFWRRRDEVPVVELRRTNPLRAGIIVVVVLAILVYFGFTKHIPFKHGFRLKAAFNTVVNIQPKSPVRVAGVDVGKVSSVERVGNTGVVTMEIGSGGLPIHSDATLKIRPRIFLEGNNFVELQPGSPSAPTISSGHELPITQTSDPVQLDQVLGALNSDTRTNLQDFLVGYGDALTRKPNAAENANQDPEVRGLDAAQALNKAYHRGPESLRGRSGHQPGDRGHRTARPLETGREHRQGHGRAQRPRTGARRTDRQLQRVLPLIRDPVGGPARDRRRAALRASQRDARSRLAQRLLRTHEGVRQRDHPGRRSHPGDRQGRAAVDRTGAPLAGPRRARRRRQGARLGDSGARKADGRTDTVLQADRPLQQMPDERHHPGRQHQAPGRLGDDRRRKLQGVLVQPRRPRRHRPVLRR